MAWKHLYDGVSMEKERSVLSVFLVMEKSLWCFHGTGNEYIYVSSHRDTIVLFLWYGKVNIMIPLVWTSL